MPRQPCAGNRSAGVDAIQRCWDRYVWIVDHVDEIGVNLTIGLLSRITDAAAQLEDHDLVEFSREFALATVHRDDRGAAAGPADLGGADLG